MYLEISHLKKTFDQKTVVSDLSLSLERGKLMCILGSSGCGKTTTLNMIGGFLQPDSGSIRLDGQELTRMPPERRPVTTVFQSYGLFPHMTVLENVIYGLKFLSVPRAAARKKGMEYLELVGLADYADFPIHQISGGQQQRVALARALIVEPKLCLLDEPFCNLDAALRVKMRGELKKLQRELHMTMVFVTHDQEEAILLADSMAIMEQGKLIQCDAPRRICEAPANDFVRRFLHLDDLIWTEDGGLMKIISRGGEAAPAAAQEG
ncbi:MAG: ABC transporter ATP-binding protein [Oscillospiraceae bacterium]